MAKINWKDKDQVNKYRREWRIKHKDRLNKEAKKKHTPESRRKVWDNSMFGGNKQQALERDNFQCQDCGMNQETHIALFGIWLNVHHKDGQGKNAKVKNNNLDNLITLCHRCHSREHRKIGMEERYGNLLEQDDSEWAYPKLREKVDKVRKNCKYLRDAKKIVAKETGLGYSTIDHRYYEKKDKFLLRRKSE